MTRLDLVILAVFGALKLNTNLQRVYWGFDGGYYADVADNFARRGALASSISNYHEAFVTFPTNSVIYPLWPLLLGLVAKVVPLEVAAVWLPTVLHGAAVLVAARLGRRLHAEPLHEGVDAGHLAAAVVAFSPTLFEHSSKPYTEPLGLLILGLALLRASHIFPKPSLRGGVELGFWAAMLLLARGPWLPLAGAFAVGSLLPAFTGRFSTTLGFPLGLALGLAPLMAWYTQVPGAQLHHLVFFEQWRVRPGLSEYTQLKPAEGAIEWLVQRARGFAVAFTPAHSDSWAQSFDLLLFAPLVALFRRDTWGALLAALRSPKHHAVLLTLGTGLAMMLALHGIHKSEGAEWNFGMRHALGAIGAFLVPTVWLWTRGGWTRTLVVLAAGSMVGDGFIAAIKMRDVVRLSPSADTTWTLTAMHTESHAVVAADRCQLLVRYAPDIGCVEIQRYTTQADLDWMVREQGVTLLIRGTRQNTHIPAADAGWTPVDGLPKGMAAFTPGAP